MLHVYNQCDHFSLQAMVWMLGDSLLVTTLGGKPISNIKWQSHRSQISSLSLKGASKALSLTVAWKELKYFLCFRESCFLQRVPPPHTQNIQNPAAHSPGQPAVADPAGAGGGTGRSPEVSSSLSTLWFCDLGQF